MKVLFLGDIVGRSGRTAVVKHAPKLKESLAADFLVVNGENAAGGFGITGKIAEELFAIGVDCITTGNHVWDQREVLSYIAGEPRLLRPLNYPPGTPGRGSGLFEVSRGRRVHVINAMGRVFMNPLDDPFAAVDAELSKSGGSRRPNFTLVDFHGDATSEKTAMGHFVDGRASLCIGTHSHVPTADTQILPGGTAFQTDAGMCGDYDSVIGMQKEEPLRRFTTRISGGRYEPAVGEATVCGVFVESDDATGLAKSIAPVRVGGRLAETVPSAGK